MVSQGLHVSKALADLRIFSEEVLPGRGTGPTGGEVAAPGVSPGGGTGPTAGEVAGGAARWGHRAYRSYAHANTSFSFARFLLTSPDGRALPQTMPDARVVAPHHLVLGAALFGFFLCIGMILASIEPAVFEGDGGADGATAFGVGKAGQRAGPGDVATAFGVQTIPAFTKSPFAAVVGLAQS